VERFLNSDSELKLSLDENEAVGGGQSSASITHDQLMCASSSLYEMAASSSPGSSLPTTNAVVAERKLLNDMNAARKLELVEREMPKLSVSFRLTSMTN
jgi:hypothetical protein